jgi:hypothetical protein
LENLGIDDLNTSQPHVIAGEYMQLQRIQIILSSLSAPICVICVEKYFALPLVLEQKKRKAKKL